MTYQKRILPLVLCGVVLTAALAGCRSGVERHNTSVPAPVFQPAGSPRTADPESAAIPPADTVEPIPSAVNGEGSNARSRPFESSDVAETPDEDMDTPSGAMQLGRLAAALNVRESTASRSETEVELIVFDASDPAENETRDAEGGSATANSTSFETADLSLASLESDRSVSAFESRNEYPIDMSTALALVSGQNAEVGFARWRIQEAYAAHEAARVLWLPSIQAGISYHRLDGNLQASNGAVLDVNRSSLQAGLGAGAVGAGATQQPGLVARFHMVDALFQPKISKLTAWARSHGASAVLHDQLLEAALAYLSLLESSQTVAIADETLQHTERLAELTADFARTGEGLQSDADRLQAELALRRNNMVRAEEQVRLASARLAEVVSFDAAYRLIPVETGIAPIELVNRDDTLHQLVATGLSTRPEFARESGTCRRSV